ncbi:MAG TPA: HAD-IIIA family hydrolase, partial [Bryobacterales bacterium]|nr:HAD-IIIA family hydrolase [Bryobacterales bacterium]
TLGYLVIVVTNQRAVARGLLTAAELGAIHRKMRQALAARGAAIDAVYCCPHEEGSCSCRKPAPGLVLEAARDFDIDLRSSILIGDSRRDRELAEGLGIAYVEVRNGRIVEIVPRR